jgi:predicted nucleotidyltransferase
MNSQEINKLRSLLKPIFEQHKVSKVVLFGSAARDTETKRSDIDLMIVTDTEKRFFDRYDDFDDIYETIKGKSLDLLIYTPQELENISHRRFIRNILSEGKVIYEQ